MYELKVEANGKSRMVDNHTVSICTSTVVDEKDFENILGKLIFAIECMGIEINTHEVFVQIVSTMPIIENDVYTSLYSCHEEALTFNVLVKKLKM